MKSSLRSPRATLAACTAAIAGLLLVITLVPPPADAQSSSVLAGPCRISGGSGTPESAVRGKVCDLYLRSNGTAGTVLYVKESGTNTNTGWVAYPAAGGAALSNPVTAAQGGTGQSTYTIGDLIQATGATTLSKVNSVSAGSYFRSNGVGAASLWSTLKLPNTATSGRVPYASATDTWSDDADLTFDGTYLGSPGHAFPATQVPSANANTLDDYEEGSFTPADASGAGLTFTGVEATYAKIGQMVFASFKVTYPATASGAHATLSGLPFTAQGTSASLWGGSIFYTTYGTPMTSLKETGNDRIVFYHFGGAIVTNANLSGLDVRAMVIYRASQ